MSHMTLHVLYCGGKTEQIDVDSAHLSTLIDAQATWSHKYGHIFHMAYEQDGLWTVYFCAGKRAFRMGRKFTSAIVDALVGAFAYSPVLTQWEHMDGTSLTNVFKSPQDALRFWTRIATNRDTTGGDHVRSWQWCVENRQWVEIL